MKHMKTIHFRKLMKNMILALPFFWLRDLGYGDTFWKIHDFGFYEFLLKNVNNSYETRYNLI